MRREAGVETGDEPRPAPVRLHVRQQANLQMQLVQRPLPATQSKPPRRRLGFLLALVRRGCRAVFRD